MAVSFQIGDHGSQFRPFQEFLNRKFSSYSHLKIDEYYGLDEAVVVAEAMRRYGLAPSFETIQLNGVATRVEGAIATDEFLTRAGYTKPALPMIFTVEGHMSDMFVGPAAFTAQVLQQEGLINWKPIGYDDTALPFDNASGVNELVAQLNSDFIEGPPGPDGKPIMWPFPDDAPWGLMGFSQGSIVTGKTWIHNLKPAATGTRLANRRDHLKRAINFGDPYREKNVIAEWVPDPPDKDTQGISDERLVDTPAFWKPHSRHGDMYSENPDSRVGLNRTAIYKIAAENSWWGGQAGLLERLEDVVGDPLGGSVDIFKAIVGGVMFLGNMAPHGTYDLDPCIEFMRGITE